jgi:hypothetical protein
VAGQGQPADVYWADRWNSAYHHFSDVDRNGSYLDEGEVSFAVDPNSWASFPAADFRTTVEDGRRVAYWIVEFEDTIARGVDRDCDGLLSGPEEITVFRDSGALDGESWPQGLDITDDGAVWWTAGLVIAYEQNGLSRLEDLNGDGDAADPGEQIVMVDGTGTHPVQHDAGISLIADPWALRDVAAAGDGVIVFASSDDDQALYRFEDFNGDGDVLGDGESILFLNATGVHPDLPMNPDFASGALPNLLNQAGYYTFLSSFASVIENGERVFYLGSSANGAQETRYTNVDGVGINFLIFKGVGGNGDRDINDAGEVTIFFDGNQIDGDPPMLTLSGLDVFDGGLVYTAEIKPFPILFPGEDGNVWIHRFEDVNGDGDARDEGEQQFGLFDLQIHGPSDLFPLPSDFTDLIADPWDFSVVPFTPPFAPEDVNQDGTVDTDDLLILLGTWGDCNDCPADINGDGTVDTNDLLALLAAWGGGCG